jgi:hypothetical protein
LPSWRHGGADAGYADDHNEELFMPPLIRVKRSCVRVPCDSSELEIAMAVQNNKRYCFSMHAEESILVGKGQRGGHD